MRAATLDPVRAGTLGNRTMRLPLSLFILALPLAEIAGFVIVGRAVGVVATIGLVMLSGIAGAILMRVQGLGLIARIRTELEAGRKPAREVVHGLMVLVAGILLLIPGFLSDIVGLLLFIPAVRDLAWRLMRERFAGSVRFTTGGARPAGTGPRTIDLDRDDFARNQTRPPRRID